MATTADRVYTAIDNTDDFLDGSIVTDQARLESSIRKLEQKIQNQLQALKVGKGGRLEGIKINLKQSQKIHKKITNIFEEEYGTTVRHIVEDFDKVSKHINRSWRYLGESADFTSIDRSMIKALQEQELAQFAQYGDDALNRISTAMYDQVIAGGSFAALMTAVTGVLRGHEDVRGRPMETYATQHAGDAVMNFHNQVNLQKAEDLGIDDFLYVGDIITTSRDFCIRRAGKVYSRREIESWNGLQWQGKAGPPMLFRGGYNCRHHWRPVRPEWLEDDDSTAGPPIEDEQKTPEMLEIENQLTAEKRKRAEIRGIRTGYKQRRNQLRETIATSRDGNAVAAAKKELSSINRQLKEISTVRKASVARTEELTGRLKAAKMELKKIKPPPELEKIPKVPVPKEPVPRVAKKVKPKGKPAKEKPARNTAELEERYLKLEGQKRDLLPANLHWEDVGKHVIADVDTAEYAAYKLHQEAFEAKMDWYRSLPTRDRIKERWNVVRSFMRPKDAKVYQKVIFDGTKHMSYRLLSELSRANMDIEFRAFVRAGWYDDLGRIVLSNTDKADTVAHEFAHAVDSMLANGVRGRWGQSGLVWRNGSPYVTESQRDLLRASFRKHDNKGKGVYTNGDGAYFRGNWMNEYEGRDYARGTRNIAYHFEDAVEPLETLGNEWFSMNVQRYHSAILVEQGKINFRLNSFRRTISDSKRMLKTSDLLPHEKTRIKEQIASWESSVKELEGQVTSASINEAVQGSDMWRSVRTRYPNLADFIEEFFGEATVT